MKALKIFGKFLLFFALQIFQLAFFTLLVGGVLFGTGLYALIPAALVIAILCMVFIVYINTIIFEKMPYIERKEFLLCYFLPIMLIYMVIGIVFILSMPSVISQEWSEITKLYYSLGDFSYIVLIVCIFLNMLIFFVSSLGMNEKCDECGKDCFSLKKLVSVTVLKDWDVEDGEVDVSKDVTLTDTDGNKYEGRIDMGSFTNYKKHELREYGYECKHCHKISYKEKEVAVGRFRKIIDSIDNTFRGNVYK